MSVYVYCIDMNERSENKLLIVNRVEASVYRLEAMMRLVENAVAEVIGAYSDMDTVSAARIIENDKAINSFEIDIDNSAYAVFSGSDRRIPPAVLRKILSIQKVNPMLERIGDHAVNIAEAIIRLAECRYPGDDFAVRSMGNACLSVLHDAIQCFLRGDVHAAERLLNQDAEIDLMFHHLAVSLKTAMLPEKITVGFETGFALYGIGQNFERIADLSMNIAEEVLYAFEGTVVKHRHSDSPLSVE